MNERIKELAKEAGITTNLDTDYFVNDPDSSLKTLSNAEKWVDYFSEKFAEMLVKECAAWIVDNSASIEHLGPEYFSKAMMKHFGVEE
jgi:hypothetical protein